ncbi:MAG: flagellar basal body-associated protein FliL [Burkholderiales bacterium]|nr:flagellar basal body-associated protein FliL [Burkholderiales bacterium]
MSTAAAEAAPAPAPKKSKLMLIIVVLLLLVIAGGAGAFFMLKKGSGGATEEKKQPEKRAPSAFIALDPFTVNLADASRDHYLQIGLTYEVYSSDVDAALKAQMPLLRSRILLLLTSKSSDELAQPDGKGKLAGELVTLARAALASSQAAGVQNPDRGVVDVHFSAFIIQ